MLKKKIFNIEDSNIEGIGTDVDKKCRESAAATEKAWQAIKKVPGRSCWRIEKFHIVVNKKAQKGIFYDDDSYIILNIKKHPANDKKLIYDIHFWLGKTTSQDEAGTAAYKTVELDDFLGGKPVQHREVSGKESSMFLGYYPHGIRLLHGGVESGFNHVEPETYSARLLWIKGKKNVRVVQVPISIKSLNSGDAFILDAGLNIYQFQSNGAGMKEKLKAAQLQKMINDEREGKAETHVFSQSDKPDDIIGIFFSYFQKDLDSDDIKVGTVVPVEKQSEMLASISQDKGGDDAEWEKKSDKILMKLSDDGGKMKFTEVAKGNISRSCIDSNDVFIFDIGSKVFVWIGKDASKSEKKQGMRYASKYLKDHKRPAFLPVTQIREGGDNEVFEAAFTSGDGRASENGPSSVPAGNEAVGPNCCIIV